MEVLGADRGGELEPEAVPSVSPKIDQVPRTSAGSNMSMSFCDGPTVPVATEIRRDVVVAVPAVLLRGEDELQDVLGRVGALGVEQGREVRCQGVPLGQDLVGLRDRCRPVLFVECDSGLERVHEAGRHSRGVTGLGDQRFGLREIGVDLRVDLPPPASG